MDAVVVKHTIHL